MTTQRKYRKYDSESDYYAMGYRMYSAEFGRFLAVDPLFEAMPRHNPYHYGFNSPLVYCDPSGLAPVKEKVKNSEKLQAMMIDQSIFEEAYDGIVEENGRAYARMSRTYSYDLNNLRTNGSFFSNFFSIFSQIYNLDMLLGGGGSGGSTSESERSGEEAGGENGIQDLNDLKKKSPEKYNEMMERLEKYDMDLLALAREGKTKELKILIYQKGGEIDVVYQEGPEVLISDLTSSDKDVTWLSTNFSPHEVKLIGEGYRLAIEAHTHPHYKYLENGRIIPKNSNSKYGLPSWESSLNPSTLDLLHNETLTREWNQAFKVKPKTFIIFDKAYIQYNENGIIRSKVFFD